MPETITNAELNRATLARQLLLERTELPVLQALEKIGGLQAQWPRAPFVALWTRLRRFERADLHTLIDARSVVRSTLMRATLHLTSATDYALLRGPLESALAGAPAALGDRAKGLDPARLIETGQGLFTKPLSFEELREHFREQDPEGDHRAMAYLVRTGLPLVQVPEEIEFRYTAGGRFTLAEAWLGKQPRGKPSVQNLVLRYLAAFGPATVADAQSWSGLRGLKPVFEELRPRLRTFQIERRELFDLPEAPRPAATVAAPVRFLGEFDGVLLGYADRSRVIDDAHKARVITKNLLIPATFLVDGRIAGTWKATQRKKRVEISVSPFAKLTARLRKELEAEGQRLGQFLDPGAPEVALLFNDPE